MVIAAGVLTQDDPGPDGPFPDTSRAGFVDPLVARLAREYGADPQEVRNRAAAALAELAGARVQSFVSILVEKKLRETYRGRGTGR